MHLLSKFRLFLPISWVLLSVALPASPQGVNYTGNGGKHTIQGRIYFPSGRRADILGVKVHLESTESADLVSFADQNGSFAFKNLTGGSYFVIIEASADYENTREPVYLDDPANMRGASQTASGGARIFNVQIYLQPKRAERDISKTAVLQAEPNIPKPAVEAYESALAASRAGDVKKAIEELNRAVAEYPQFALAFAEMGVQYIKLNQFDEAATAFRSSLAIVPEDFTARLGYGIALQNKKDFFASEKQLREALQRNDTSPTAHMYLGITMVGLKKLPEAQKELERAINLPGGDGLAKAHKYLGGIYWGNHNYKRAADELEKYLKLDPAAPDAARIRDTIKDLRSKQ